MLSHGELQALREIGKTTSYNAGNALSEFLGKKIVLHQSFIDILGISEIHRNIYLKIKDVGIMIFARLQEGINGELIFILDEKTAFKLINLSKLEQHRDDLGALTELGVSLLKETGNMVIGSYITALSEALNRSIPPPLPVLISGTLERTFLDVFYHPNLQMMHLQRYLIQTDFEVPQEDIKGNLSLALASDFAKDIKALCTDSV